MTHPLNIPAIESSLIQLQQQFSVINETLSDRRDPLTDTVIDNMMSGYRAINEYFAAGCDPFAMGQSRCMLELNQLVLYGAHSVEVKSACHSQYGNIPSSELNRPQITGHNGKSKSVTIANDYFYGVEGCIDAVMDWLSVHSGKSAWYQAAGMFCQILSQPQLFLEGNHRTATLLMSYLLVKQGEPPCVLTVDSAKHFFEQASLIKKKNKSGIDQFIGLPKSTQIFANQLKSDSSALFLT